jgi:histidinol-phosphate/aromatic aminotransferase/cobyric acid decarboxylase-like protein
MIKLTHEENLIADRIKVLKNAAGTHSPSIFTVLEKIPELEIKVDACFLSNPYATDLFVEHLKEKLIDTGKIRDVLEFYPSQNAVIAELLSNYLGINKQSIFIGNGAIEIIQAILHNYTRKKIVVNIPTFSSYYEFLKNNTEVVYNKLLKEENFELNIDAYIELVKKEKPDTIVLINPNNPNGGYIKYKNFIYLIEELSFVNTIIVDESFIHFAYEDYSFEMKSIAHLVESFQNLVVVKSMSKDFGIAGIRAGYGVMSKDRVSSLLKNGYLWNSSGLAEFFFRLYIREDFLKEYEHVRVKYIRETQTYFNKLSKIKELKVYPSLANFALIELLDGTKSDEFVSTLLIRYGIYSRTCNDKIGLDGEFIRLASRTSEENATIIHTLNEIFS